MILIAGIPDEPPVARAIAAAEARGIGHVVFDQRDHAAADLILTLDPLAGWRAVLRQPVGDLDLASLTGAYVRLMDERFLPDIVGLDADAAARGRAARFHALFHDWLNIAPIRIANRPRAMLSNMSKTYQATLIRRAGLAIPETMVTNDPAAVMSFDDQCAAQGDARIYKSVSGTRSIVQTFAAADRDRLHHIRWCPTQFQRKVRGTDTRVHVVGQRVFATRIESAASDYRYARRQTGEDAELVATTAPPAMAQACVRLAAALDLPFAGVDLRLTPTGETVCFEVNPSPAYSYYEDRTGVPIADALVRWLAGDGTVGDRITGRSPGAMV